MPKDSITEKIPVRFQDVDRFLVFRYLGKLPMVGVRVRDVLHILWIAPDFRRIYQH